MYSRIVPQYNEYGYETGLWMYESEKGIAPNLVLGWVKGEHRLLAIEQVEDCYEDYYWDEDLDQSELDEHVTDLGTLDCSDTVGDEWEQKFAEWADKNDKLWWLI